MFLIDDGLAASVKWVLHRDQPFTQKITLQCDNTIRIWIGLFCGTTSQILSRFTWEIIQTLFGFIAAQFVNLVKNIRAVNYYHGSTVLEGGGVGGSLCMGAYIFLHKSRKTGDIVCMHEYGHALQSRLSGPLYLFKYGISSILLKRASWVEADANFRALTYFRDQTLEAFGTRSVATVYEDPKWWEYLLFFLGIGIVLIPILNFRRPA